MFLIGHFGGSLAVDRGSRGFLYSCTFYGFLLKILVLLISILSVALTLMYHLSACVIQKKRYLGRRSWRILIRWENVNKAWECLALKVVIRHYTSVRKIRTRSNLFIMEKWFLLYSFSITLIYFMFFFNDRVSELRNETDESIAKFHKNTKDL